MVNAIKDIQTLKCIINLTQLLQTMTKQIEEFKRKRCKSQKLCE